MKKIILFLIFWECSLLGFAQRDTIAINDNWQFATDKKAEGINNNWFESFLPASRSVQLPHTWNIEEENIGDGSNKFFIILNGRVNYGKENIITVAVNNDYGKNKVPFGSSFDWPNDGGIIRPVSLIVSDRPSASYIHATPQLNVDSSGKLKIRIGFGGDATTKIKLTVTITEGNQLTKNIVLKNTATPTWHNGDAIVEYRSPKIAPWHFDFPNLYRVDITILNSNKATDNITANVGFRDLKILNGQTFLNGERVKLMGVEWMAGSNPDYGFAETDSIIISQGKLMKDVNCIFSRQHFQQSDLF